MEKVFLFIQLGSPEALTINSVKKFLKQFLMDKRVVDLPFIFRFLLVYIIIANFRAPRTLEKYKKIWDYTTNESPLLKNTHNFVRKLQQYLNNYKLDYAFRYGKPSIEEKLKYYYNQGIRNIHIIPLFPQYSTSTFGSVLSKVYELNAKFHDPLFLSIEPPFFDDESFITLWVDKIRSYLPDYKDFHFNFHFHGIPETHIKRSDIYNQCLKNNCCDNASSYLSIDYCYKAQCSYMAKKIVEKLSLQENQWKITFQSRLGKAKWIGPYLEEVIKDLNANKLVVLPLSFVSDCLETLEEIDITIRNKFLVSENREFYLIPSLNDDDDWINYWQKKIKNKF